VQGEDGGEAPSPVALGSGRHQAHDGTQDRVEGNAMEKIMWLVLGATVMVAALRADGSHRARVIARVALGSLFLFFGAVVNAIYLLTDWDSFAAFGEMSQIAFVRETWASLVTPNTGLFIGLLIVGQATMGILVFLGGRRMRAGLVLLMAFHVGLLFFGWWLWLYALPMLGALALLLRAERRNQPSDVVPRGHGGQQMTGRAETHHRVHGGAHAVPAQGQRP
jgi:hypothetical protein